MTDSDPAKAKRPRRKPIQQADLPAYSLEDALRVPRALGDEYAFTPVSPLDVAKALKMQPQSGPFRMLLGASMGYQLTDGSAWAEKVAVTSLGRRIIRPIEENDDWIARREAFLKPRIIRDFLSRYDGNKVPREDIGRNVLETIGVPPSETSRVMKQIVGDARTLGLLADINGIEYVQLKGANLPTRAEPMEDDEDDQDDSGPLDGPGLAAIVPAVGTSAAASGAAALAVVATPEETRRVYITHGKNKAFIELLTKLLKYGEMEAVVSVQHETVSMPVPDKVIGDMRKCGAAIIHVDAERTLRDEKDQEHVILNQNVLIEIGAAMALYDKRFILLVRDGVELPSNLQGLLQVRYKSDTLDAEEAMKLLEAIADIKNHRLPGAAR